jgi:tetratricopeptide (TPR) repeat protein
MSRSPYPGLRPFEPDETDIFFGRETHVDAMVNRLGERHFLAVTGASGSGKSSLVKAGLIEALEIGLLAEAGPVWRIAQMHPGDHPMEELAEKLVAALGSNPYEYDVAFRRAAIERGPLALVEELKERPLPDGGNLLIIADQFEELFRYEGLAGREEAEAFVALLLASARQRGVPIYVVLTMRSEYFGYCAEFEGLAETISDAQYLCPRLTRDQIAAAIEGPAAVFGGKVEPRLVARIINDMGTDADQLPLMQHVLMRLWEKAKEHDAAALVLRLDDYLAVDGIKGCLSRHADEILAEVTGDAPQRTETAKRLFCLVTDGEGERAVRRLARVSEVLAVTGAPLAEVAVVADAFRAPGRSLLLPPLDRRLDQDDVVDISHESLIRQWQTLKDWAQAEALSAEQYRETERLAQRWARGTGELWDGIDLAVAWAWRQRERPIPAWATRYGGDFALAMRFLDESRHAERRRRLIGRTVTAVAFAVVLLFAGLAVWQWRVAVTAKNSTESALTYAMATANTLVFNFAVKYRDVGMPVAMIKDILNQARELQDILFAIGEPSPGLQYSRAEALNELAFTLLYSAGDTKGAIDAATKAGDIAKALLESNPDDVHWQHNLSIIDNRIGDVLKAQGRLDEALGAYRDGLDIGKRLTEQNRDNNPWQRKLSERLSDSESGVGDVLKSQGHLDDALNAYRDALAIDEALSWQPELARIEQRIGAVLKAQGHLDDALVYYRRCLEIMRALAQNNPDDTHVKRNLKASHDIVGTVLKAQGHLGDALAAYREGLAIIKKLAATDPENTPWQSDLATSDREIGDALKAQGHLGDALAAYREALDIAKTLMPKDPDNAEWQNDLSESYRRIGDVLRVQGHLDDALAAYRDSLAIGKDLAMKEPSNLQWQSDLALSDEKIGGVLVAQGHLDDAFAAHQEGLTIRRALALKDASNAEWQSDLSESDVAIGDVLKAQGHPDEALAAYRDGLAIRMTLTQKDPGNVLWQTDLAISLHKVASAGDEPEANLAEAIAILKRLDAAGTLWPEKKGLISDVETALGRVKAQ